MKKLYFEPEMRIARLSIKNIVTASAVSVTSYTKVKTISETAKRVDLEFLNFKF